MSVDPPRSLFGAPSLRFDGGAWFTLPLNEGHVLNVGDFTIDGWAQFDGPAPGHPHGVFLGKGASFNQSYYIGVNGAGYLCFWWSRTGSGGAVSVIGSTSAVGVGFFHFEVARAGSTISLFLNGVLEASATVDGFHEGPGAPLEIGRLGVVGYEYYWRGNLREVRVTKGVARHTESFAVPTAPPADNLAGDEHYGSTTLLAHLDSTLTHQTASAITGPCAVLALGARPLGFRSHDAPVNLGDRFCGGRGVVVGTVKEKSSPANVPLHRKVWLLRERDGIVIREAWSDAATGSYAFTSVDERERYTVIAFDHEHNYRAVIADNLIAEVT
ncbi:MAG: LamG domain-containing protein [Roseateles sp.]|uniref:LamG domain-containing protein n=1 Tax=Roseateles sp. TaxID=1971397 RepID=UPI0039EA6A61